MRPTSQEIRQDILDFAVEAVEAQLASKEPFSASRSYNYQVVRGLAYLYGLEASP